MSSWVLGSFTKDDVYIEYEWDKYAPHYVVFVGRKGANGLIQTIWIRYH